MQNARGFTLLELLVVMAIASILLAIAVPSFRDTGLAASRAQGSTSLFAALNQARSEAIARNRPVTICRRDFFKTSGFPECAVNSGSWAQGWIVFADSTGLFADTEPDALTDVIAVFDPIGSVHPTTGSDDFLVYTAQLTMPAALQFLGNGRVAQPASFTLCERSGRLKDGRRISVSASGGISLEQLSAADTVTACAA